MTTPLSAALPAAAARPVSPRLRIALRVPRDPRWYQIAVLAGLLGFGLFRLRFDLALPQVIVTLGAALLTQLACTRLARLPAFDPKSALISGLSLCLLLRTDRLALAALAAAVAIASKFALRVSGKHVFNPTNLGITALLALGAPVWVSPGQWGSVAFFAFLMACLGGLVVNRAARGDVTLAFLCAYAAILFGRALWLGQRAAIPLHQLESGALLLFAFFMISDPKTTPRSRAGRVLFAALVACGAAAVQFLMYRTNGLLWSLVALSPLVPLLDRWLPGPRYEWSRPVATTRNPSPEIHMKRFLFAALCLCAALAPNAAHAFCGFYVATGDARLFNQSSKVVLVRDDDRTVLTMGSDFRGEPSQFALVVPVPVVLERDQIHVGDPKIVEHLDAYSAPRLVEYFDENPCMMIAYEKSAVGAQRSVSVTALDAATRAKALGVTIEASYTVGEYDILILSAKQSTGLETWLNENHYRVPPGASRVLGSYLKQGMKFFVAKVNLKEQAKTGFKNLRPLQMAYESPKFMLPIRLGMVNADGPQELFVYALTRQGRIETTNYRTVKIPSDAEIPEYVKEVFPDFYRAMFRTAVQKENLTAVFLEYAWDMGWCDPCSSEPLSQDELRELGVFWLDEAPQGAGFRRMPGGGTMPFVTRLHLRYDAAHFPEDLVFQQTADRTNFQGRYILRHPWTGTEDCPAAQEYRRSLRARREKQATTLAALTGWKLDDIRARMKVGADWSSEGDSVKWYQRLWKK